MREEQSTFRDIVWKTFAIIGTVAVLLVGMWLAVTAVQMTPRIASSLASAIVSMTSIFIPGERIEIAVPDTVESEKPFTISWNHLNKSGKKGAYAFSFTCAEDLYFTSPISSGGEIITCNSPLSSTSLDGALILTSHTKSKKALETTFTIAFVEEGKAIASAESRIAATIAPSIVVSTPTSPTTASTGSTNPTKPKTPGTAQTNTYTFTGTPTAVSNPSGTVDLRVKVLATGVVDRVTGAFTASSSVYVAERVGVKFEIENIGTRASGPWAFNAQLPTIPFHTFQSAQQISLMPGDKIEYTIGFDSAEAQNKVQILINVDPSAETYDIDRTNNTLRQDIFIDLK